mmetsp:Transcript_915/g.1864  ORF Transcript_915/g.1864 Transcript_915/m.1864 type:complete len:85 (-) Transcript_915:971-1225(-)
MAADNGASAEVQMSGLLLKSPGSRSGGFKRRYFELVNAQLRWKKHPGGDVIGSAKVHKVMEVSTVTCDFSITITNDKGKKGIQN